MNGTFGSVLFFSGMNWQVWRCSGGYSYVRLVLLNDLVQDFCMGIEYGLRLFLPYFGLITDNGYEHVTFV